MSVFPDAEYLVLSSRLIPDLDGGYTLATLARARQMAAAGVHGGRGPLLLTVDPGSAADHASHRAAFAARGLDTGRAPMRNLFDEAGAPDGGAAPWLRDAAHPGEPAASVDYRVIVDAAGRPVVSLPVIANDLDWHTRTVAVVVHDAEGGTAGIVDGFGALYRAWLSHVVVGVRRGDPGRPVVVIVESRQLGELLAGWDDPGVRLVHAIHTIHLEPPFHPDGPLNPLWTRWFEVADRFDAVLWPTAWQRDDVQARFGASDAHAVVPNAVEATASVVSHADRDPRRVVMLNRLAPGKRVDHAIRAVAIVRGRVPDVVLDVYGDGSERGRLQNLVDELGLGAVVTLRGATDDVAGVLETASAFLSTSAFEGQGLAIAEALAHGCPVVAYDIRYGPRDLLTDGGGMLVPDADVEALAAALVEVLTDGGLRERLGAEAVAAAEAVRPERAMSALAAAVEGALARPARR